MADSDFGRGIGGGWGALTDINCVLNRPEKSLQLKNEYLNKFTPKKTTLK